MVFPTEALAAILKTRLARPTLSEADWVEIRTHSRHMKQNAYLSVSG